MQERDVLLEPWFHIDVAGQQLGEDMLKYVTEVEVVSEDNKLGQATITIADYDRKWLDGTFIGKGSAIVIRMGHRKNSSTMFRGKISFMDADYPEEGYPSLVLTCTELGIDLMKSRYSRVYKNMKVSDVVKSLHKLFNIECEVQDSKTIMKHIPMNKETPLEFIKRWQKTLGWKYFEKPGGGYYFGTKLKKEFPIETLGYRTGNLEIISFTPTFTDIETEDDGDEGDINSKGTITKTTAKTGNSSIGVKGSDKVVGKA